MRVNFKKLSKDAVMPYKTHEDDMCYDVTAATDAQPVYDEQGNILEGVLEYELGLAMQIAEDDGSPINWKERGIIFSIDMRPRSSISKTGLIICNCEPTIDNGYTGPIKVRFYNILPKLPNYKKGDKIAQMKIGYTFPIEFVEVSELSKTTRGDGGFGSTGK